MGNNAFMRFLNKSAKALIGLYGFLKIHIGRKHKNILRIKNKGIKF